MVNCPPAPLATFLQAHAPFPKDAWGIPFLGTQAVVDSALAACQALGSKAPKDRDTQRIVSIALCFLTLAPLQLTKKRGPPAPTRSPSRSDPSHASLPWEVTEESLRQLFSFVPALKTMVPVLLDVLADTDNEDTPIYQAEDGSISQPLLLAA